MAVVATLSKGYDLDYIWAQVDCGHMIASPSPSGLHTNQLQ
jgi:hypothetical protein